MCLWLFCLLWGLLFSCGVALPSIGVFVLLYFVFVVFDCCVSWACRFLKRDREEVDPEGVRRWGKVGGLGGVETVVRIYCMREDSIFNKR